MLGHFIPRGTYILANFWAVHHDANVWDNPFSFNPDRYLNDDSNKLIKSDALIPFSIGKRSCIGETLARVEVFLYITFLLQKYRIESNHKNNYEDSYGFTLKPKEKAIFQFKNRI